MKDSQFEKSGYGHGSGSATLTGRVEWKDRSNIYVRCPFLDFLESRRIGNR